MDDNKRERQKQLLARMALFVSCADHMLDNIELFVGESEFKNAVKFHAKGLKKECEKLVGDIGAQLNPENERRSWEYKSMQEEYLLAFASTALDKSKEQKLHTYLKEYNERENNVRFDDERFHTINSGK